MKNFAKSRKMSKFGTKNAFFGYLWARFFRKTVIFEMSNLELIYFQNFCKKTQKWLNLGPKIQNLHISRLKFSKNYILTFEIRTLKFVYLQSSARMKKCLNLWPKTSFLGIFELEFLKNNVRFEIRTLKFTKF